MNNADFEKIAGQLAEIATTAGTEKTAANSVVDFLNSDSGRYLLGGVGGFGAGAILGATQPDKEKRRQNMLYYGTLGGLGGLGLAHLASSAPPAATTPPPPGRADADAAAATSAGIAAATTPRAANAEPPQRFNSFAPDIAMDAGTLAQKLPGMSGVSPAVQAAGGSAGLAAGLGLRRYVPDFARVARRYNTRALTNATEANTANLNWINKHTAARTAAATAEGRKAVEALRGLGATPQQLQAAMRAHVHPTRLAALSEIAAATKINQKRLEDIAARNLSRTRFGKILTPVLRAAGMLGTTAAGMTAPTWSPEAYNAVNDWYLKNTGK
jgi:hypothetical protein